MSIENSSKMTLPYYMLVYNIFVILHYRKYILEPLSLELHVTSEQWNTNKRNDISFLEKNIIHMEKRFGQWYSEQYSYILKKRTNIIYNTFIIWNITLVYRKYIIMISTKYYIHIKLNKTNKCL